MSEQSKPYEEPERPTPVRDALQWNEAKQRVKDALDTERTIAALRAEVDALKHDNARLIERDSERLVEIEALTQRIHNAYEEYAGLDGVLPETAPEAYLLQVLERMALELKPSGEGKP